jgi:hypothetical protein
MWTKKNYMKLIEEKKRECNFLLGGWEKLSFDSSSYEAWSLFGF